MAGQIPDDPFAGSLSDPDIDPFEMPEAAPEPEPTPAGQARASAKPVPGPISPDKKLPPENLYSKMRSGVVNALTKLNNAIPPEATMIGSMLPGGIAAPVSPSASDVALSNAARGARGAARYAPVLQQTLEDLKSPALTQEQPNPAYQPWLDQGLAAAGEAINPENPRYGMTGKLVGMIGGAMPGTMASEVPLKSIPIWGGAMIAKHGGMEEAPFREAMLKDFGPKIEPQLGDIYQKSKGIYETHIAKASLDELGEHHLPNLQNIVDQYNKGIEGQDWYLKTRPELERQFGPDSDLFINMLAATSPNATVPANMSLALKAYKAYKNGLTDFNQFSNNPAHPGFMKPVIDNLNRAINNQPISGQKIINFARNLRGETEPVTVDRWMMRALGMPKAPLGPNTYKFADYWLSQVAHDMGVEPRQLQAAVWKTAREVGGQSAATGQPFETMLAKRLAKDPQLAGLLNKVRQAAPPAPTMHAQGGLHLSKGAIDGGWYGENAPGPLRMQDGGWWQGIKNAWNDPNVQPNPAYGSPGERTTNAQKIFGPWLGGHVNAVAQGVVDPAIASLQLLNRATPQLPGMMSRDQVDEQLRQYREQYKQSLPGGKEDWTYWVPRLAASGMVSGSILPEINVGQGLGRAALNAVPGKMGQALAWLAPKIASGMPEGAMYGTLVPKESPNTMRETGIGAIAGSLFGPIEKAVAPPLEQGIAALMGKFGASPETASKVGEHAVWHASDIAPDPSIPGMHQQSPHLKVPSQVEHEAEAGISQAAAEEAQPALHAIARHITRAASDIFAPDNFTGSLANPQPAWQPPSPPTPPAPTPDQQGYDPLYDPLVSTGEPYAGGGLYGQLRKASLQALHKAAH